MDVLHLFFMNDLLLFGEASRDQTSVVFECLDSFTNLVELKLRCFTPKGLSTIVGLSYVAR
uniref:Reverse transcriptase domain-containing protein n=1 Tax=Cajanus cajan TaxID=3821 RepID=A0A151R2W1_CAJCA|nr:hypothetical protein KK1_041997 [Cajanus cajan]